MTETIANRKSQIASQKALFTFHLIPNAHLDPVWLWDWREGLNEGLVTCRTILDLMDENKALTFIRGETFIYEHIERTDPETFARIRKYVKQGRWDPVGGTVIQPDTNLPDAETFARHFLHGQRYLKSRFGKPARAAWAADSFGHAAGLPEILANAGIEYFAFTRPASNIVPLAKPAFWWRSGSGARVLAYRPPVGWYGCEREEMTRRLDGFLADAGNYDLVNLAVFFGLGNHGGGPTRRHLEEIGAWSENHPEIKFVFSGLHTFFDALKSEVKRKGKDFLPTHDGELNFVLRGCYSSVAKFKFLYRKTEAQVQRAEKTDTIVRGMGVSPMHPKEHGRDAHATLGDAWDSLLFNSFHDILPGSSIERAFEDQMTWLGGAYHAAQKVEFEALNLLASRIDTSVVQPAGDMPSGVALLVFNPHPFPFTAPIELEAALDYRPIWKYQKNVKNLPIRVRGADNNDVPFQIVDTEHHAMVDLAWRKRVVVEADLPPFGWAVYQMSYDQKGHTSLHPTDDEPFATASSDQTISNGIFNLSAAVGGRGVQVYRDHRPLFDEPGLQVITVEDPWGSWGGMAEEPESVHLSTVRDIWKITHVRVLERGPIRAKLWVRFEGGRSRLDLTFLLTHARDAIDCGARLFLNERSARVKLVLPAGEQAEYQVPAARVTRGPCGEVPGGKWVRVRGAHGTLGFASDALYNFETRDGALRATIARASRYADDVKTAPEAEPFRPAVDAGELKFNFLLTHDLPPEKLAMLARQLEQPAVAMLVPPHGGELGRSGSLASLTPSNIELLALKRAADGKGLILRIQETGGKAMAPTLTLYRWTVRLPKLKAHQLATYRLIRAKGVWTARATGIAEM